MHDQLSPGARVVRQGAFGERVPQVGPPGQAVPRLDAEEARDARLAPEQRIGVPLAGNAQIPARFRFLELDPGGAQALHADAVVVEEPGCERDGGLPGEDGGLLAGGKPVFVAADPQGDSSRSKRTR